MHLPDVAIARPRLWSALRQAERDFLRLILVLAAASLTLSLTLGRNVDWLAFLPGIAGAFGLVAVGAYARAAKDAPRLAAIAIGIGIFMGFTAFASIFIFALFPLTNPLIDAHLSAVDAALGYDWVAFVEALAGLPLLARGLGLLYQTSLPQLVVVIILLGLMRRETTMHRFLFTGIFSMSLTVGLWWLWPSLGPGAHATVPEETAAKIGLLMTPAMGDYLRSLAQFGPAVIDPAHVTGVVAFPSYHMIMALLALWYARRTPLFPLFALTALGMVPATLSHGGHHLVDLIAGAIIFAASALVSCRLFPAEDAPPR